MASLSTCHLGLWLGWQILLNLVKLIINQMSMFMVIFMFNMCNDTCSEPLECTDTLVVNPWSVLIHFVVIPCSVVLHL